MNVDTNLYTSEVRNNAREWIINQIYNFPYKLTNKKISEFASESRMIDTGPRQGLYDPNYTPYLIEPIDELSINSITQRVIFMKPAQIGATTGAENLVCYYIKEHPTDQMYISGNDKLLKIWSENKLDKAIVAFGIENLIRSGVDSKHSKKTGDTVYKKEYSGCSLILSSARSSTNLRCTDRQILIRDEIDSAPINLASGEGNWMWVSYVRTNSWGPRRKILDFSTPVLMEGPVHTEFLKGDCREFNVACPICNSYQVLKFGNEETPFGLKGIIQDGRIKDAYYICEYCTKQIKDMHKGNLLKSGFWKPTKEPDLLYTKSYSINSLYSPPGMLSFVELFEKWTEAKTDTNKLRSFTNLYMGLPWENTANQINVDDIITIRSDYKSLEVPDNVLFITLGADVQEGSTVDKKNPPRIELEITGHGRGYKTWSILYKTFFGKTTIPFEGAWEELDKWILKTGLRFYRKDEIGINLSFGLIDSGNGNFTNAVYQFCKKYGPLYPSKGFRILKIRPGETKRSDLRVNDKVKYRKIIADGDTILYTLSTIVYKDIIYNNIQIPRQEGDIQKSNFCDFPSDYKMEYFRQLTSEKRMIDDNGEIYYTENHTIRNEPLDCRVLNLCAADIYLDLQIEAQRKFMKDKYRKDDEWLKKEVRSPYILTLLENQLKSLIKRKLPKYKK